ncbi:MAG: hypothetical protein RL322_906, partial [Pseudomonadota bacterium]
EVQTFVLSGPVSLAANTAYGLAVPHGPMLIAVTDASPTIDEVVASWIAQVPPNAPVALTAADNTLTLSWTQPGAVDGVASVGALTPLTANAEASISRIELINAVKQSQVYGLAGLKILVSELADSDGANESTSIVAPLPPPLVSSIAGPTQASEGSSIALTINFANPIPVNSQIWWQAEPAPGMEAGFTKGDLVGNFATDWPRGLLTLAPTASDSSKALTGSMTLNLAADSLVEGNEGLMVQVGVMSGSAFIADGYAHPILISSGGEPPAGLLPAVLDGSFLKVPGTTAAPVQTDAVSNNGTPNDPTDDQIGRVSLDGVEKVTVAVGPISPGSGQLPANAEQLFAGIKNATSAEAFATAVSVAKQSLDVRFWVDKGAFNIDSDATLEPNVQALLNYVAPASGQGTVNFAAVGASPPADSAAPASTSVSFTNTTAGGSTKSAITLRFSEAVGINGAASPTATQVAAVKSAIVIELNPPQDGHSNQAGGTPIVVTGISGFGTSTLTLTTDTNLQAESLVRVKFPDFMGAQFESKLTDLSGNLLPKGEVWGGGSGDSTIVLDSYFSDAPITLRGNSGDDLLIGSNRSDIFVDGDGRDTISGGDGQDFIVLHESDLTTGTGNFARDVVEISLGQSVNGGGGTRIDHIQPSASNPTTSGFDVVSPVSANHDVLSLPSARIAADTLADIDGADNANSGAEITIGKHSIADGIITFKTGSGDPILIKSSQQVTDAMGYLGRNFTPSNGQPGTTVAFKYDRDANNTADSLFVYQQPGQAKAGLAVGETMPPTSVLIRDLIGIGSVKLGNQDGPYVLQLIDTQIPEPINIGLTQGAGTGMQIAIDFAEPVTALGSGGATLRLNGITPVSGTLASASGTSQLLISLPGTVTANDWVMLALDAVSVGSSAIVDSAGNVLQPGEGDAWGGIALGSSAANTINLGNASNFPSDREYDIDSGGGNDTIFGSAGNDNIRGGSGSDSITSASGNDMLSFVQGDSPAVTLGQ